MATEVKRRRGTTSQHSTFTGAVGEITVDTTKNTSVVHDGSTAGGFPVLREDLNNLTIGSGLSKSGGTLSLDDDLSDIAALTPSDGNFIVGNGTDWITESGNTAIASLGITATASELNILDGATLSTTELNYVDGVTSSIQTQLNNKQPLDSELTTLSSMTSAQATGLVGTSGTATFNAIDAGRSTIDGLDISVAQTDSPTEGNQHIMLNRADGLGFYGLVIDTGGRLDFVARDGGNWTTALSLNQDGLATFSDSINVSKKWSSSVIADNSFYSQDASDGFAFGLGSTASTWFSWDSVEGQNRAIDVWNDGSQILLGVGGANVGVGLSALSAPSYKLEVNGTGGFANDLTVEANLFVEGGLFANEFVVNTTRVLTDFAMSAGGKVGEVINSTVGSETVSFVDEDGTKIEPFGQNDIIHIQVRTGSTSGTVVKNIWRQVSTIVSSNYVLTDSGITWTAGTDDVGVFEVGDDAVRKGNTNASNTDRDHYIKFDISGTGGTSAPTVSVFNEVQDVNDDGSLALAYGNLDGTYGITGEEFGFAVGDSFLTNNHIVLTPSTTAFQLDTFKLATTGLDIDSSTPSITLTGTDTDTELSDGELVVDDQAGEIARLGWNQSLNVLALTLDADTPSNTSVIIQRDGITQQTPNGVLFDINSGDSITLGNGSNTSIEMGLPIAGVDGYTVDTSAVDDYLVIQVDGATKAIPYYDITSGGTAPATPTGTELCKVTVGSSTFLRFRWGSVTNVDNYRVYRSTDGTNFTQVATVGGTRYDDVSTASNPSTTYYYYVRACNAAGCSAASTTRSGSVNSVSVCT